MIDIEIINTFELAFNYAIRNAPRKLPFGIAPKMCQHYHYDFATLDRNAAIYIYRQAFWRFDDIKHTGLAIKLLDIATSPCVGLKRTITMLQLALCNLGNAVNVTFEGDLDVHTIDTTNSVEPNKLVIELISQVAYYYMTLIKAVPQREIYVHNWVLRMTKLPREFVGVEIREVAQNVVRMKFTDKLKTISVVTTTDSSSANDGESVVE